MLPTYLALFFPETAALINIRVLRLLRIFRILKLAAYIEEYRFLGEALIASRRKIAVFLATVLMIVLISGTLVYLVERPENGFTSIPVVGLLGDHDGDHRRVRRHRAEDRHRPVHRLADDAARLGHPRRADGHRHRRDDGAAMDAAALGATLSGVRARRARRWTRDTARSAARGSTTRLPRRARKPRIDDEA